MDYSPAGLVQFLGSVDMSIWSRRTRIDTHTHTRSLGRKKKKRPVAYRASHAPGHSVVVSDIMFPGYVAQAVMPVNDLHLGFRFGARRTWQSHKHSKPMPGSPQQSSTLQ
ncbi:hypothetical protein RRG08_012524 [Elysia crispata]|uniref:Uncharacterized protein n=1 Tax=Elysia crispata TaxID=231223 RepID=A0AAE1E2P9_9GAST|nr:hypothetical protein RRG08_012524 [Elysia crispata]